MADASTNPRIQEGLKALEQDVLLIQEGYADDWPSEGQDVKYITFDNGWSARPVTINGQRYVEFFHGWSYIKAVFSLLPAERVYRQGSNFYVKVS